MVVACCLRPLVPLSHNEFAHVVAVLIFIQIRISTETIQLGPRCKYNLPNLDHSTALMKRQLWYVYSANLNISMAVRIRLVYFEFLSHLSSGWVNMGQCKYGTLIFVLFSFLTVTATYCSHFFKTIHCK